MGTTPIYKLPYVESSDAISTYPTTGKANATLIEAELTKINTAVVALAPRAGRYKNASQTLSATAVTTVTYEADDGGGTGIDYFNGVFTVSKAGLYQISANTLFGSVASSCLLRSQLTVADGSKRVVEHCVNTASANTPISWSYAWRFAANETFTISAQTSVAGAVITGSSTRYSTMSANFVAP